MKQKNNIIASTIALIMIPIIIGIIYGLKFGYFSLFCVALASIFFNLDSFSSFKVFQIEAELSKTAEKTDRLDSFSILYVKNELESIKTRADSPSARDVAKLESFSFGQDKPSYHFNLSYTASCIEVIRIKKIIKILDISDKDTLSLLEKLEMKNALELQDSFELTIQSYKTPDAKRAFEHSEALQKFSEDRELSAIFDSFKASGTFDFDRLAKLKQHLESLPGDEEYLSKNWQSLVHVMSMLLVPLEEVSL
ncbi:hypothetical protein N692_11015 [Lactiplantibacillus plantarum EGD-AQ4]|nr:hypothetical protein N692_11015 [Lactiplantibacillus plantarum EGD-AQ4]